MATAKEKRIQQRLEQIKEEAAQNIMAYNETPKAYPLEDRFLDFAGLVEEAAGLGLELLEGRK